MGFHKRFIDDNKVIDTFREYGCQAVIDMYTKGIDAIITNGELSNKVSNLLQSHDPYDIHDYNKISITIARASYKKRMNN